MKPKLLAVLAGMMFLAASCASSSSKQSGESPSPRTTVPHMQIPTLDAASTGAENAPPEAVPSGVHIPSDAQWTIVCNIFQDPDHIRLARETEAQLKQTTTLKDWYVIHQQNASILYYGFYSAIHDKNKPDESARAERDRQAIMNLTDSTGAHPFSGAMFFELNPADPPAPSEWNLANVPLNLKKIPDEDEPVPQNYWSLQIAAFKDSPQRKQAAVDSVKAMRAHGVEAYYYHGESTSSVCVGLWPYQALKKQQSAVAETPGEKNRTILVSPVPLPSWVPQHLEDRQGERVTTMVPRIEPIDPTMIAAMKYYAPFGHAVNGYVRMKTVRDSKTGQTKRVPADEPFLVLTPKASAWTHARDGVTAVDANAPQQTEASPIPPSMLLNRQPQGGKLRSVKDR